MRWKSTHFSSVMWNISDDHLHINMYYMIFQRQTSNSFIRIGNNYERTSLDMAQANYVHNTIMGNIHEGNRIAQIYYL